MSMQSPAQDAGNRCFDRPGFSGPDNSAISFPGIENSAGQIGGQLPRAGIAFSFLHSAILF
jgi:hypothetical protein